MTTVEPRVAAMETKGVELAPPGRSRLPSILGTVDDIRTGIEFGKTEMVIADTSKFIAQFLAEVAAGGFHRTYSALEGFGRWLSLWRLGHAVSGRGTLTQQALAGHVASELVGAFIDGVRAANLGGWIYELTHEPMTEWELKKRLEEIKNLEECRAAVPGTCHQRP